MEETKKTLAGTRAWDTYMTICIKSKVSIAYIVSPFKRGDDKNAYFEKQDTG